MIAGHCDSIPSAISAAPYQGLGCSWANPPEFRFASLRALVPAPPSGALAWEPCPAGGVRKSSGQSNDYSSTGLPPIGSNIESRLAAPEARRNTARSAAQRNSGKLSSESPNPWQGVTDRIASKVAFVEGQTMCPQQNLEFLEERNASMMFFLPMDVTIHLGQHRLTHRERAISLLPLEARGYFECPRNPARGVRLQLTNELRDRPVLPQFRQNVNVVGRSVDDQRDSTFVANCTAEVLMRPRADFPRQPGLPFFRRKDDVIQKVAIGGTHSGGVSVAPLRGLCSFWIIHPEFRFAPLRALVPPHPPGAITQFEYWLVAPEARRSTARSGAQRNSGKLSSARFANPWEGVTDQRAPGERAK